MYFTLGADVGNALEWLSGQPPWESTYVHCLPKIRCNWHHAVVSLCFLFLLRGKPVNKL